MRRGDLFITIMEGMAVCALALVLLFPAIMSTSLNLRELCGAGALDRAGDFGFASWLKLLLSAGDSGSLSTLCSNFLRSLAFFSLLVLLVVPGEWPRHLKKLYLGSALFLGLGLLSVYFGCAPYDGVFAWGNVAAAVCVFVAASTLAYRCNSGSCLPKTLLALEAAALVCMAWAWKMYAQSPESGQAMYGNFYNQNMFSGWLLLVLPSALLGLASGTEQGKGRRVGWYSVAVLAAVAVTLYFGFNRTAWAVGAFVALFALGFDRQASWKSTALGALLSGCAVLGLVALAVLGIQGCWLGAGLAAAVSVGAVAVLAYRSAWLKQAEVKWRLALTAVLALALVGWLGYAQAWGTAHACERLQDLSSGADSSGLARGEFFRCAWGMSLDHPLLGVGPQGFGRLYPSYQKDVRWFSRHTHCAVLDVLSEYGFINAIVFLGLFISGFVLVWRMWREDEPVTAPWRLGAALGCLGLFLHAQGAVDLFFTALPLGGALVAGVALGTPTRAQRALDHSQTSPVSLLSIRASLWGQYGIALIVALLLMLNVRCTMGDYYGAYARYCFDHNQLATAVDYYRSAASAMPFNSEFQVRLVQSMLGCQVLDTQEAKQRQDLGVEMDEHSLLAVINDPQRALCHTVRGQALEASGRWEEALGRYQTALNLDHTTSPEAFFDVSRAFLHLGQEDKARQCLQYLIQNFPSVMVIHSLRCPVFSGEESLRVQELFLAEMSPADDQSWEYLKGLETAGYPREFVAYLRAQMYLRLAQAEAGKKQGEQSQAHLKEARLLLEQVDASHPNYRQTRKLLEQCR